MEPYRLTFVSSNAVPDGNNNVRANKYEIEYNRYKCRWVEHGERDRSSTLTLFGAFRRGPILYTFTKETYSFFYEEGTGDKYDNLSGAFFYEISTLEAVDNKTIVERRVKLEYDFLKEGIAESRAHGDAFYVKTNSGNTFYINPVTMQMHKCSFFPPLVSRYTETYEDDVILDVRLNEQGFVTFMTFGHQVEIFDVEGNGMSAIVVGMSLKTTEVYYDFFAAIRDESGEVHFIDTIYVTLKENGSYEKITSVHPVTDSPGKLRVNGRTLTLGHPVPGSIGSICDSQDGVMWFYWSDEDRKDKEQLVCPV